MPESEFNEYWGAMADWFGAITKNNVGYGHSVSRYYNPRGIYGQHAEFLANTASFYYNGNPVFKAMFPKAYDEAIRIWDDLIKNAS